MTSDPMCLAVQMGFDAFRIAVGLTPNHPYDEVMRWLLAMHEQSNKK